jgi:hypothetical protein
VRYPTSDEVEQGLKLVAAKLGDASAAPFRVGMLPVNGGKPPLYTVVILSPQREVLRSRLGQVLNRSLSLGVSSFSLKVSEAHVIFEYGKKNS